ncbi:MAG TPA: DUF1780 domain-containing protein [Thermoanaerobaculia bacterium]
MSDEEFIEEYRQGLRDAIAWFSNENKRKREIWVVSLFLNLLGLSPLEAEVLSVDDVAPDVLFRDAYFEVKEFLIPGRRRTDEFKEALARAESPRFTVRQAFEYLMPQDLTAEMILNDIFDRLPDWQKYEPRFRSSLDLLVYHNRDGYFFKPTAFLPDTERLASSGFRSVCVCTDSFAWVLWASSTAPEWIASQVGTIRHGP